MATRPESKPMRFGTFRAAVFREKRAPKEKEAPQPAHLHPASHAQHDRHRWLHDEAQSTRSRQAGQDIVKKPLGK